MIFLAKTNSLRVVHDVRNHKQVLRCMVRAVKVCERDCFGQEPITKNNIVHNIYYQYCKQHNYTMSHWENNRDVRERSQ